MIRRRGSANGFTQTSGAAPGRGGGRSRPRGGGFRIFFPAQTDPSIKATEVERPAFASSLRWLGVECKAGVAEECLDEGGPVLDALEPVLHDGGELVDVADGEVAQAGLSPPMPLGRIQLGRVTGAAPRSASPDEPG